MKHKKSYLYVVLLLLLCGLSLILLSCAKEEQGCDHDMIRETVIEPTCDKEGKTVHQCVNCPFSYATDIVAPLGHTFSLEISPPTCDKEGYTDYACACGYSFRSDYKLPSGHAYQSKITPPTCTAAGYTVYTCPCGRSYTGDHVPPTAHTYTSQVTPPTCTESGYTQYTCHCGSSYKGDHTPPKEHTYTSETLAATCTEAGYTLYACACGHTHKSDLVAPLGHRFQETVTLPTVSTIGFTEFHCDCGTSYTGAFRSYRDILRDAYAHNSEVLARGIDVSKWNHEIGPDGKHIPLDWEAIKAAGVDYVILKAGSSKSGVEPTFEMDYAGAKAAGLDVGAYFYTYSTTVAGTKADAALLLTILEGKQFEYPIYFDLEDPSMESMLPSDLTELCVAFCTTLQAEGYYAGVYTNLNWLTYILETDQMFSLFEIWFARWTYAEHPVWNESFDHLGMWQYTDRGSFDFLEGIPFDLNFAYKDYPTLIRSLGLNGFEPS